VIREAIEEAASIETLKNIRVETIEGQRFRTDDIAGAEALAKRYNASLIIWGDDTGARIIVNFLNLRYPRYSASSTSIKESIRTLSAAPQDYIQLINNDLPSASTFLSLFAVGQSAFIRGDYLIATEVIEKALENRVNSSIPIDGTEDAMFLLGYMYDIQENLPAAIDAYNRVIDIQPQYVDAYVNRCQVRLRLGDPSAIEDCNLALQINPQHAIGYNNRAAIYFGAGDHSEAINDFSRALMFNSELAVAYAGAHL
jgi:tetratricopeptide (TPR) repeat protein